MMRTLVTIVAGLLLATAAYTQQLRTPTDWKWRQDSPAPLVEDLKVPSGSWMFVAMPPGWHVTNGPGVLLYPAGLAEVTGNFSIEIEAFLFPGEGLEEFGVFFGGRGLESSDPPQYIAAVLRGDGRAAILQRANGQTKPLADWTPQASIVQPTGTKDPVRNVLRVDLDPKNISITVNGAKALTTPRNEITTEGRVGLRIGKGVNVHIASFDLTTRLAPQPVKK